MEKVPLPQDTSRFKKLAPDPRPEIRSDAQLSLDFLSTAELVNAPKPDRAVSSHSIDMEIAALRAAEMNKE